MNKQWFFFFFARQGFQSFMHTPIASGLVYRVRLAFGG